MINLDILSLSPLGCMLSYNYYTSLVTHTVLPLLAVGALLLVRTALKASGHPAVGTRCAFTRLSRPRARSPAPI